MAIVDAALVPGTDMLTIDATWAAIGAPEVWQDWSLLDAEAPSLGDVTDEEPSAMPAIARRGAAVRTPLDDWFERVHVVPRRIDAGDILATTDVSLEFFNAYRYAKRVLSSYVNNAGAGIAIPDLPSLPTTIDELSGLVVTVEILTEGPAEIDGDLLFVFDDFDVDVPITGTRTVVLAAEPVLPLIETLSFRTSVLVRRDGTEQRSALRLHPRQSFDLLYELDGPERQWLEARVFGAQERTFSLPLWAEAAVVTEPALIGASSVTVDETDFRDFRVGEGVILWSALDHYQSLILESKTATSLTFTDELTMDFARGTRAMPARSVRIGQKTAGSKLDRKVQRTRLRATVVNAGVDLSSAAAFSAYNGRVLLDDANKTDGTLTDQVERNGVTVDGETGLFDVTSTWPVSRRASAKTFLASQSKQRLWEIRQVLHHLRGKATSFYLPTFFDEFEVTEDVSGSSSVLRFRNFGFTKFVDGRSPRGHVRLVRKDGTTSARAVFSSVVIDDDTEEITVGSTWGISATIAEIERVEYLELSRFDSDDVEIRHSSGCGDAEVAVPVKAVLE